MKLHGKKVALVPLEAELRAAGIATEGLAVEADDLATFRDGLRTDLPPEAQPVVDAHVPPPVATEFAAAEQIDAVARTTDAAPRELLRFPLAVQTGYDCTLVVMGVDAGNGAVAKLRVDATIKRLNAGPLAVAAPTTTVSQRDAAASAWAVALTFSGNDALVSVTGAAGRSIDWIVRASVARFAPSGIGA